MTSARWLRTTADTSLGAASLLLDVSGSVARAAAAGVPPVVAVPARRLWQGVGASPLMAGLRSRGARARGTAAVQASRGLDRLVPALIAALLRRTDLTSLVHEQVDIDRLVKDVDVDAVAGRIDVDAVAGRLDLDAVVARLDLTEVVLQRVDLERVVQAVLSHVDLVGLAEYVVDAIDLPDIIRDSSGALTSDTIRGVRMRGVAGDSAIRRIRDRLLHDEARSTPPPGPS